MHALHQLVIGSSRGRAQSRAQQPLHADVGTTYFLRNKKLQETPPAEKAQPECMRGRTNARTLNGQPCEAPIVKS